MLAGSHLIFTNAIFVNLTQHNVSAFILGVISHHLADRLPHIDLNLLKTTKYKDYAFFSLPFRLKFIIFMEFLLGIIFIYYYFIELHHLNQTIVFYLSLGSIFPDLLNIFLKNKINNVPFINKYIKFHKNFHFHISEKNNRFLILLSQLTILIISLIFFKLTLKIL